MTCTVESHALLRTDVDLFDAAVPERSRWGDLYVGNCKECGSTLALMICACCSEPCPSGDCLPFTNRDNEDAFGHFACLARRAIRRKRMTIAGELVRP